MHYLLRSALNVTANMKTLIQGDHPKQMKQIKVILKAEDAYVMMHTSAVYQCQGGVTNDGWKDGNLRGLCPRHPYAGCQPCCPSLVTSPSRW